MFVVVTALALMSGWVVYNLNWIRQRNGARNWIADHQADYGSVFGLRVEKRPFPWVLRLLGEQPEYSIAVSTGDVVRVDDLRALFPEATILNHPPLPARTGYSRDTYGE
jgi:hypothetical protein